MDCNCNHEMHNESHKALAMAYIPWQSWGKIYDPDRGFQCGTIFEELNLPFYGCRPQGYSSRQNSCRRPAGNCNQNGNWGGSSSCRGAMNGRRCDRI